MEAAMERQVARSFQAASISETALRTAVFKATPSILQPKYSPISVSRRGPLQSPVRRVQRRDQALPAKDHGVSNLSEKAVEDPHRHEDSLLGVMQKIADAAQQHSDTETQGAKPHVHKKPATPRGKGSRRQLILGALAGAACACPICDGGMAGKLAQAAEWGYDAATGPEKWGGMCAIGTAQSPIDIPVSAVEMDPATKLSFDYKATTANFKNTGHGTMQVDIPSGSNVLRVGCRKLELLQFHFHAPSEHSFNGVGAAMEAHLVHRDLDNGGLLVVGVMIDGYGKSDNYNLREALMVSPDEAGAQLVSPAACMVKTVCYQDERTGARRCRPLATEPFCVPLQVNPMYLLPNPDLVDGGRSFVNYQGSLTTPPCSEGVDWFLMTTKLNVPEAQVTEFMKYVGKRKTLGTNSRPLQPIGERQLLTNAASFKQSGGIARRG